MDEHPNQAPPAAHDAVEPHNDASATTAESAVAATPAALADHLRFTLTVPQARALFVERWRKVPAERTLQNHCAAGLIAAQKIRTTYGSEWLINEASLSAFIETQAMVANSDPLLASLAAPPAAQQGAEPHNDAAAGDSASAAGGASLAIPAERVGETRTLASVLLDNAKLLATLEGKDHVIVAKDETITEMKEDRKFLREELTDVRKHRGDSARISERMLETLEIIATRQQLSSARATPLDPVDHE